MATITYEQFRAKLMDPTTSDEEIAKYIVAKPAESGPFDPALRIDKKQVDLRPTALFELQTTLDWANSVSRWRREAMFELRSGEKLPVLVSEGDSWFQFPFLLRDVVDQLGDAYLIWSMDAAGDTAANIVFGPKGRGGCEYLDGLARMKNRKPGAFLFSAAGNDVIGRDSEGNSHLVRLLRTHEKGRTASWHINYSELAKTLKGLDDAYRTVIGAIRKDAAFKKLPIILHGYGYSIPGGFPGDTRNPIWAEKDQWLGAPMRKKKIVDVALQREIIRLLIDALYDMLEGLAGDSAKSRVFVVDARPHLGLGDWADEIHPTNAGFAKVAKQFRKTLKAAGVK